MDFLPLESTPQSTMMTYRLTEQNLEMHAIVSKNFGIFPSIFMDQDWVKICVMTW